MSSNHPNLINIYFIPFILGLIFIPFIVFAQQNLISKPDSFNFLFESAVDLNDKIEKGLDLVDSFYKSDKNKAIQINEYLYKNVNKIDDVRQKAKLYYFKNLFIKYADSIDFDLGLMFLDTALVNINAALENSKDLKFSSLKQKILKSTGINHYNQGNMDSAILFYQESLDLAIDHNLTSEVAALKYNSAIIHYVLDNYDEALPQLEDAYQYAVSMKQKNIESASLTILGSTYQLLDSFELAEKYLRESIKLAKREMVDQMYHEALIGLALVFEDTDRIDSAIYYLNTVLESDYTNEDPLVKSQVYLNLARLEYKRGDLKSAKKLYSTAKAINKNLGRKELDIQYGKDVAALEYLQGNYQKAYNLLDNSILQKDSFNAIENRKLIKELQLKYDTEKAEKELAEQTLALTKKEKKISNLTTGFLFSILGMIMFYGFYRNAKRNEKEANQELAIKNLKIEAMEKEKSILAITSTLEGQEAERARIAHDLHDGLGGLLSSVKAHFSRIEGEIKQLESINLYEKAQSMMDNACDEVRRISHNLMPPLLKSQGLPVALENLVKNKEVGSLVKFDLDIRNMEERLSETQEVFLYRIIQELVNNSIKHGDTDTIEISLYGLQDHVQLIIEDDGKGFDVVQESGGMGLSSVKSRVEYLKGELELESNIGKGTNISIQIPK